MSRATERELPASADLVIVGGGFAGLSLAVELERRGVSGAVVLESGPDAGRDHYRWVLDGAVATRRWLDPETDAHFWRPYSAVGTAFTGIAGLRRRLGGRSLYWHGSLLPIESWALRSPDWPEEVVRDLVDGWEGGASLYSRIHGELSAWSSGANGDHKVRIGEDAFTPTPLAVRRSADSDRWKAYSPLEHLPDGARVFCDCHVLDVVTSGHRTAGVRVLRHGQPHTIRTPRVVLAAGTIETSRLAIQTMTAQGLLREPSLTGMVDKIAHGFVASFDPGTLPADLRAAAQAGAFLMSPRPSELRSNLFLRTYVNRFGVAVVDAYLMGEQTPGPWGAVTCEPGDGQQPWPTRVACEPGPADRELVDGQRRELQRIWDALCAVTGGGASRLAFEQGVGSPDLPRRLLMAEEFRQARQPHTYSFPLGSEQHEAGTLPLGGLLDDRQQIRGVDGLHAAGPAVFPRTGAANPVMTILALSRRLAAGLAA